MALLFRPPSFASIVWRILSACNRLSLSSIELYISRLLGFVGCKSMVILSILTSSSSASSISISSSIDSTSAVTIRLLRPVWISRATAKQSTSWARPAEEPAPSQTQNGAAVASVATTNEGSLISLGRNSDTGGFARCFLALFVGRAYARGLLSLPQRPLLTLASHHHYFTSHLLAKEDRRQASPADDQKHV
jgi:hypothetical protein